MILEIIVCIETTIILMWIAYRMGGLKPIEDLIERIEKHRTDQKAAKAWVSGKLMKWIYTAKDQAINLKQNEYEADSYKYWDGINDILNDLLEAIERDFKDE